MGRSRGYVHRVDIRAEAADVWQALIDPVILARWHVPNARVDAREGGSYWTRLGPKFEREAHIDIYKPPQRLRLLYMPSPDLPDTGVVPVDDFLIDKDAAASRTAGCTVTVVRLIGSGIPEAHEWDPVYTRLRGGWERALLRLKAMFERSGEAEPGTDVGSPGATQRDRIRPRSKTAGREDRTTESPESQKKPPKPQPRDDFIPWPEPTPDKKR